MQPFGWPLRLSAAVVMAAVLLPVASAGAANTQQVSSYFQEAQHTLQLMPEGYVVLGAAEAAVIDQTNAERARGGLGPVVADPMFTQVARFYAFEMLEHGFFDHRDPDGRGPLDRLTSLHRSFVGGAGENLFRASGLMELPPPAMARVIMDQMIASAPHHANILNPEWRILGVGIVRVKDEVRAVQLFGNPLGYLHQDLPLTWPSSTQIPAANFALENGRVSGIAFVGSHRPLSEVSSKEFEPVEQVTAPFRPGSYQTVMMLHDSDGTIKMAYGPQLDIQPSPSTSLLPRAWR